MDKMEFNILKVRQSLKDKLCFALKQNPTFMFEIKDLKIQIAICDLALNKVKKAS